MIQKTVIRLSGKSHSELFALFNKFENEFDVSIDSIQFDRALTKGEVVHTAEIFYRGDA